MGRCAESARILACVAAAGLLGCSFAADYTGSRFRCQRDAPGECPEGQICVDGFCDEAPDAGAGETETEEPGDSIPASRPMSSRAPEVSSPR